MELQRPAPPRARISKGQAILGAAVLPWLALLYLGMLARILLA